MNVSANTLEVQSSIMRNPKYLEMRYNKQQEMVVFLLHQDSPKGKREPSTPPQSVERYEWGCRQYDPPITKQKRERNARLELIDKQLSDYGKPSSA